jgi:hypothetical protein
MMDFHKRWINFLARFNIFAKNAVQLPAQHAHAPAAIPGISHGSEKRLSVLGN